MLTLVLTLSFALVVLGGPFPAPDHSPTVHYDARSALVATSIPLSIPLAPTSIPTSISFPARPTDPFLDGIPDHPGECDGENPSQDCFNALASTGGYLWYDKDSQCSDEQKSFISTAAWDANTLAFYSSSFPNAPTAIHNGMFNARYWMGPDYTVYQSRISGNLKRVWQFKTSETSGKVYITISCADTKNECNKDRQSKSVGGYSWTYSGWFGYYHYITWCPPFFTLDDMDTKLTQVQTELANGQTRMASDMNWLQTSGQYFLHEMMHTRIADGGIEPHIIDEWIDPSIALLNAQAYGPAKVHALAKRGLNNGGGATRASTNADSYAMVANSAWWWDTTGYFPLAKGMPIAISATNNATELVFPDLTLGNVSDLTTVDYAGLYAQVFAAEASESNDTFYLTDPDFAASSVPSTTEVSVTETVIPLPAATTQATDICRDSYKFIFDHFEIHGKSFDPSKLGVNGAGLENAVKGCGVLTAWKFETLTNDPNGYQWFAMGNLPPGTKSYVGSAVDAMGGNADGCTGAG